MQKLSRVEFIVVHHSLTEDGGIKNWEAIRRYHVQVNGWEDIGYHAGIEYQNGRVVVERGRGLEFAGAHCSSGGMNSRSLGLCVVGNYDLKPVENDKWEMCLSVVKGWMGQFGVDANRVLGHREAQERAGVPPEQRKTCPGLKFDLVLFRKHLTNHL